MSKKLFSLEDIKKSLDNNGNDLLIDKVLKYKKLDASPVSVTSQIIADRQKLKEEIVKQLNGSTDEDQKNETSEENTDDTNENESNSNKNSSNDDNISNDNNNTSDISNDDSSNDDSKNTRNDNKNTENSKNEESINDKKDDIDDSAIADDKDSLKSIIGSGLEEEDSSNKKEDKKNVIKKDAVNKEDVVKESFKLTLKNIFKPIHDSYNKYLISLEDFNVPEKLSKSEQPIVYVKDSVLKSINNLLQIANTYIAKNKTFIEDNTKSIKNINERLTVLRQFVENRKFHFTNKLVNDPDLLSNLSVTNKSNIIETSKYLISYLNDANKFVNFILANDFEKISSSLINSNFIKEEDDFVYKQMLPGFNKIRVHIENYTNYLDTNIENFHYYKVKVLKTEDIYNLEAISIVSDKDIDHVFEKLDKLLIELSMTIDNFDVVNANLNKLIDELKVIAFDIEKNRYNNLASIDLDSKIKDFIKLKLVGEAYYINVDMSMSFILNSMSVVNGCIELKS